MNPRVKNVVASPDHKLHLEFTNGEHGIYDCAPFLEFGVFRELQDVTYFMKPGYGMALSYGPMSRTSVQTPCIWIR
jgi:hypothetical protein